MENELNYESPRVRIVKAIVEKGFAGSVTATGYGQGGNAWGSGSTPVREEINHR